jgi:hypothetical protein
MDTTIPPVIKANFKLGDKVIWWKRIPGGDYVYPVAAVVIALTAKRVKIQGDDDGELLFALCRRKACRSENEIRS